MVNPLLIGSLVVALASPERVSHPPDAPQAPASKGELIAVAGGRLYVEECGSGRAIILLHDGLLHSVVWDDVWPGLCSRYHVVRYDRRGFGRSDSPTKAFSPVEDLAAVLEHAKIAQAAVVGCSSGAALAIDFAIRHPELVEDLVLIGAVVHGMPSSAFFVERGARNNAPLQKGDVRAAAKNWSEDRFEIGGRNDAARRKVLGTLAANPQNLRYSGEFELHFKVPAIARLSEIHVPTLILDGERDIPDVHAQSGAIQAGIWGSRREVIAGVGHLVPLEAPADLNSRIAAFVEMHRVVTVPRETLATYVGRYEIWGSTAEVALRDGRLTLTLPAEKELPLFASSETAFFMIIWGETEIEFTKDAAGAVTGFQFRQGGQTQTAKRVSSG
jgi:3-oxoadipate enol-lactonase